MFCHSKAAFTWVTIASYRAQVMINPTPLSPAGQLLH